MNIEEAIQKSKQPGSAFCPECNEELFAPMDKLSIYLYGKCAMHFEDDSPQQKNIFRIINEIF